MMLKVVLQYTDCMQDGRNVFNTLANHSVAILKTQSRSWTIYPRITIVVRDYPELNDLVCALNCNCSYEVRVVKTKMIKEKTND
jgi:hypothetical protein